MKYKNKLALIIVFVLSINTFNLMNIQAASYISMSNPSTVTVGDTVTVTFNNGSSNHTYSATLVVSGAASGTFGIGLNAKGSQSVTFKATSTGSINLQTTEGKQVNIAPPFDVETVNFNRSISSVSGGGGGNNSGGGGNSGGGNNSGGGGGNSGGGNAGGSTQPRETEAERIAREEREAEEAKAAEAKKVLISSIEVKSNSDKRKDQVLTEITTEDDNFEYSYNLPSFIEDVILNVVPVDESVSVEYDIEHKITEEKKITIKASKEDISQEYVLTLAPNDKELIKKDDGYVYQDEKLDEAFKSLGFEITEVETDGKTSSMFTKNQMHLQMIMNDDNEVQFYRLDENGVTQDKGQIIIVNEDVLFVTAEVDESLRSNTLYGNSYKEVELPLPDFVKEVDESLKIASNVKGWTYDDGKVVNAIDTELQSDLYNLGTENQAKAAVVAFDKVNNVILYSSIGLNVALIIGLIVSVVMLQKSRKEKTSIGL